jgi:hypothetical protein
MSIVQVGHFTGKYALSKAFNDGQLRIVQIIEANEFRYLNELFGVELYEIFLDNYLDEDRFIKLMNPFSFERHGKTFTCRGITQMLLGFIYAHYRSEMQGVNTSVGQTVPNPEASELKNDLNVLSFWNESIRDFNLISYYMQKNKDVYPEFKGCYKLYNYHF